MKKFLQAAVIALTLAPMLASAGGSVQGVLRFTGSIVRSSCPVPAETWTQHAGRSNGISPANAGAVPQYRQDCAGVIDTQSISTRSVSMSNSSQQGKIVIVSFN